MRSKKDRNAFMLIETKQYLIISNTGYATSIFAKNEQEAVYNYICKTSYWRIFFNEFNEFNGGVYLNRELSELINRFNYLADNEEKISEIFQVEESWRYKREEI